MAANKPDSPVLRYLRKIDAKLDRISKQLATKVRPSPKKQKRRPVIWARTPEEKEKLKQERPDADVILVRVVSTSDTPEQVAKLEEETPEADLIIVTGVPRADD